MVGASRPYPVRAYRKEGEITLSLVKKPQMTEEKLAANRRHQKLTQGSVRAEIVPTHPHVRLMRRMQDSNLREVRRATHLLLELQRQEGRMEAWEKGDRKKGRSLPRYSRNKRG